MDEQDYDPSEYNASDVVADLEEMSEEDKRAVAAAEMAGKNRTTVLKAAGVEDGVRLDASGRELNDWEVTPKPAPEAPEGDE